MTTSNFLVLLLLILLLFVLTLVEKLFFQLLDMESFIVVVGDGAVVIAILLRPASIRCRRQRRCTIIILWEHSSTMVLNK